MKKICVLLFFICLSVISFINIPINTHADSGKISFSIINVVAVNSILLINIFLIPFIV